MIETYYINFKKKYKFKLIIEQNIKRLNYLLNLYRLSPEELSEIISEGKKKPITKEEILADKIELNYLKRIDKMIFNKGLHYYLDPTEPKKSKEASIFFRKETFNSELNIGTKKIVNNYEDMKIYLSAISKLVEIKNDRKIPKYSVRDNVKDVAFKIREYLYPEFSSKMKDFLNSLIFKFAEYNIMVFEFVETWNKKEKANIDGFYLKPNVIVLKRQQRAFRREIFTIAHELAHYLLNEEEIDKVEYEFFSNRILNEVERWCNDFAYYFLIGESNKIISNLKRATSENDFHHSIIEEISRKTHLSKLALYTRLLYLDKISRINYNNIKDRFEKKYRRKLEEEKMKKEIDKEMGIEQKGSIPRPIKSPLFIKTLQIAFHEGVIDQFEFCKKLNIKPEKIDQFIQ